MQHNESTPETLAWHALEEDEIFSRLQTSRGGLAAEEAARRLAQFGPNVLPAKKPRGVLDITLHQFKSPLIYILMAAGLISLLIGDLKDAGFIFLVVAINAVIGFAQEWKAEQSAVNTAEPPGPAELLQRLVQYPGLLPSMSVENPAARNRPRKPGVRSRVQNGHHGMVFGISR